MDNGNSISRWALTCAVQAVVSFFISEDDISNAEKFATIASEHHHLVQLLAYQLENCETMEKDLADKFAHSSQEERWNFYASLSGGPVSES